MVKGMTNFAPMFARFIHDVCFSEEVTFLGI